MYVNYGDLKMSYEFKKYSEIENSYRNEFLEKIHSLGYDDPSIEYVAEIKVDGSNFSVAIDENDKVHYAKRTAELERGESFSNYEYAMKAGDVVNKVRRIKEILGCTAIVVYGELAGGKYNHPDVPKEKFSPIQGRVQYAPFVFFYAFDIVQIDNNGQRRILDEHTFDQLCKEVNLIRSIVVKHGSLKECLEYPNDIQDPVGQKLFNLPPIENNITEGIVIKPVQPLFLPNGSRIIIKNKNEKFKEKMNKTGKKPKVPDRELTDIENMTMRWLDEYKTESRLHSVLSKVGSVSSKDFGKIMGLFMTDLFEEFNKDYGKKIEELENTHEVEEFTFNRVTKKFQKEVQDWIRPVFINIINTEKYNVD